MTRRGCEVATLLWGCVLLFAMRVIGQFEAMLIAPVWLPDMDAWYSGLLPYYLLLPAQIVLLMFMAVVAWNRRVRTGRFAAGRPKFARSLRLFAGLYFAAMAVRLGINAFQHGAEFWHFGAIPVAFHWVLALFVLVSARPAVFSAAYARLPDYDELPHGDVPAFGQDLLAIPGGGANYRPAGGHY
jgi:hypothetical protein